MPACSSSLLARLSGRLGRSDQPTPAEQGLVAHLATVPDPRDRRGVRHRLASLLSVAVCAVLAGARSLAAIGDWAADAPAEVLTALGARADPLTGAVRPPDESTVRRVLVGIDGDALDAAVGAWLAGLSPLPVPPAAGPPTPREAWPAVALGGKTLRGSGEQTEPPVHLLAAMRQTTTAVLGQVAVDGKTNEMQVLRITRRDDRQAPAGGAPSPCTQSPTYPPTRPAQPTWPTTSAATGASKPSTTSAT